MTFYRLDQRELNSSSVQRFELVKDATDVAC